MVSNFFVVFWWHLLSTHPFRFLNFYRTATTKQQLQQRTPFESINWRKYSRPSTVLSPGFHRSSRHRCHRKRLLLKVPISIWRMTPFGFKLTKLFDIDDFSVAKGSGKVLYIYIYIYIYCFYNYNDKNAKLVAYLFLNKKELTNLTKLTILFFLKSLYTGISWSAALRLCCLLNWRLLFQRPPWYTIHRKKNSCFIFFFFV